MFHQSSPIKFIRAYYLSEENNFREDKYSQNTEKIIFREIESAENRKLDVGKLNNLSELFFAVINYL